MNHEKTEAELGEEFGSYSQFEQKSYNFDVTPIITFENPKTALSDQLLTSATAGEVGVLSHPIVS